MLQPRGLGAGAELEVASGKQFRPKVIQGRTLGFQMPHIHSAVGFELEKVKLHG
jgi:hypothetical protein